MLFTANLKSFAAQASGAKLSGKVEVAKVKEEAFEVEEEEVAKVENVVKVEDGEEAVSVASAAGTVKRKVKSEGLVVPKLEEADGITTLRRSKRKKAAS